MSHNEIIDKMMNNPVIAAVASKTSLEAALVSPCEVIFILEGTLSNLRDMVQKIHNHHKLAFIHVDLMKGLAHDLEGLEYLRSEIVPDGVISTKSQVIKKAKELGFVTVQRVFVLDSKSIERGARQLREMRPDFVEVMPGAMAKIIERMKALTRTPIIAGGLIDSKQEIIDLLRAGAVSISTSARDLWYE